MNAQELRIGNWVMFKVALRGKTISSRYICVTAISEENCVTTDKGLPLVLFYKSESLAPIPLNEEILLKAGFENSWGSKFWTKERWFALELEEDHFLYDLYRNKYVEVYTLQQLQNLYYALTGTELTINLEAQP